MPPVASIARDRMLRPQIDSPVDTNLGSRADDARLTLITLRQLCGTLAAAETSSRRSVVVFGEGLDFDVTNLIGTDTHGAGGSGTSGDSSRFASDVIFEERALIDEARRANVAFYTIDPRGNSAGEGDLITLQTSPGIDVQRELSRGQQSSRGLADLTGGLAIVGVNDPAKSFHNVVQANSTYYVLAYSPEQADDGKFRRISVSVKRPDVNVVHRQGYFAVAGTASIMTDSRAKTVAVSGASAEIRAALANELPLPGLGMKVSAAPISVTDKTATIVVTQEIDTDRIQFEQVSGLAGADMEMAFAAIDADGAVRAGNRSKADLKLPADQVKLIPALRRVYEATVPRGIYHVRVAACQTNGPCGSAMLELDAVSGKPDVFVGPTLLTAQSASGLPTAGATPSLDKLLPSPAVATRDFQRSDTLGAVALVAVNSKGAATVSIETRITGESGREEFSATAQQVAGKFGPHVVNIPLSNMSVGAHTLTFTARLPSGPASTRVVTFRVR